MCVHKFSFEGKWLRDFLLVRNRHQLRLVLSPVFCISVCIFFVNRCLCVSCCANCWPDLLLVLFEFFSVFLRTCQPFQKTVLLICAVGQGGLVAQGRIRCVRGRSRRGAKTGILAGRKKVDGCVGVLQTGYHDAPNFRAEWLDQI